MRILFAADVCFNDFKGKATPETAYSVMGNTASVFGGCDFSIINLENMIGDKNLYTPIVKTGPNLISDESFMSFIDVLKPTALGLANNHLFDYGNEAFIGTAGLLKAKGYLYAGAGQNIDEAYKPLEFTLDGERASVFCVCENEFGIATDEKAGAAGYSLTKVTRAIKSAREKGFFPIIYFHGGNEHNPFPSPKKIELYRHFADMGAGAVIAMHTHCPQGYEIYSGVPIIYSMGNFFFPEESPVVKSWNYGYMTMLSIKDGQADIEIIPYRFDFGHHSLLEGKEKEDFFTYLKVLSKDINNERLMKQYFDAWCRIAGLYGYLNLAKYTPDMLDGDKEKIKEFKNLFSCEAHNELINTCATLIYENRIDEARQYEEYIRKLQNMTI